MPSYKDAQGKIVQITEKGYRELEDGGVSMPKELYLIALVIKAAGGEMNAANCWQLTRQLLCDCGGDIDAAIAAVKSGEIHLTKAH